MTGCAFEAGNDKSLGTRLHMTGCAFEAGSDKSLGDEPGNETTYDWVCI